MSKLTCYNRADSYVVGILFSECTTRVCQGSLITFIDNLQRSHIDGKDNGFMGLQQICRDTPGWCGCRDDRTS